MHSKSSRKMEGGSMACSLTLVLPDLMAQLERFGKTDFAGLMKRHLILSEGLAHTRDMVLSQQLVRSTCLVLSTTMARTLIRGSLSYSGLLPLLGNSHSSWLAQYIWYSRVRWLEPSRMAHLRVVLSTFLARSTWYSRGGWLAHFSWYSRSLWLPAVASLRLDLHIQAAA
jgi:hypothetical protein